MNNKIRGYDFNCNIVVEICPLFIAVAVMVSTGCESKMILVVILLGAAKGESQVDF